MSKKSDTVSVDVSVLHHYEKNTELLNEVNAAVWDFSEPGDDAMDCVYRILEELYEHKAEVNRLARLLRKYESHY